MSFSQAIICVPSELTEFFAELTEFAAELSEFSRNSTLETVFHPFPVSAETTLSFLSLIFS